MGRDPGEEQERPAGALPVGYARSESTEPQPVWVALSALHPDPSSADPDAPAGVAPQPAVRPGAEEDEAERAGFVGAHGRPPVAEHQLGRLDFTREVIGRLHHWDRDLEGVWYGVVDYVVPRVGDIRAGKPVTCGLVPAAALRPRVPQVADPLRF